MHTDNWEGWRPVGKRLFDRTRYSVNLADSSNHVLVWVTGHSWKCTKYILRDLTHVKSPSPDTEPAYCNDTNIRHLHPNIVASENGIDVMVSSGFCLFVKRTPKFHEGLPWSVEEIGQHFPRRGFPIWTCRCRYQIWWQRKKRYHAVEALLGSSHR